MGKVKLLLTVLLISCLWAGAWAQEHYYWYGTEKVPLRLNADKRFVLLDNNAADPTTLTRALKIPGLRVEALEKTSVSGSLAISVAGSGDIERYWAILANVPSTASLVREGAVLYEAPVFFAEDGKEAALSHLFYVKLHKESDIDALRSMASRHGVEVLGSNTFMPLWYLLACNGKSTGNALEMANLFHVSGRFAAAEPDLMTDDSPQCVNDPLFPDQWGLQNTGQHGGVLTPDIDACDAWLITTGSDDVIVAVLDHGIEFNHPDLTNMHPVSFDSESGNMPSLVLGSHGVACAGIIGAELNNSLGVAGISYDCPLMSISNSLMGTPASRMKRADGINFAWQNGASVISNSWGSSVPYTVINDAISDALTLGRNGLGMVVVFSAGNGNSGTVGYPGNVNPDILAVGAMSPCGERKNPSSCDGETWWGSDYGTALDVVAPGVLIPTTDRVGANGYTGTDYMLNFNGTSSAAPHVAALAGLILSVNPHLTQKQVADIIESTAQKVNPAAYPYATTFGRPNGTWHIQMGYGLINAEAAVTLAQSMCTAPAADLYVRDKHNDFGNEPNPDTDPVYWDSQDIWVRRQNDGFSTQVHQNPEYRPPAFNVPNYIYVKVRNRGCTPSSGAGDSLKVYWAKAATALSWPAPWDGSLNTMSIDWGNPVGAQLIGSLNTGDHSIFEFEWYPPDPADYTGINTEPWHFCLLARIETSASFPHGMTFAEGSDLWQNVRNNNNIAWRNISVIDSLPDGQGGAGVLVRNVDLRHSQKIRLTFTVPQVERADNILNHATVRLKIGEKMLKKWINGGRQAEGIEQENDSLFRVLEPGAWMGNMDFGPGEGLAISAMVEIENRRFRGERTFDIVQGDYASRKVTGGERFKVVVTDRQSPIGNLAPPAAGRTDLGVAEVTLFPNPASTELYVRMSSDDMQRIVLYDMWGRQVYQGFFVGQLTIDTAVLPGGMYFVETISEKDGARTINRVLIER